MTNTDAQKILSEMIFFYSLNDAELEAIEMAGRALDEKITEERHKMEEALRTEKRPDWCPFHPLPEKRNTTSLIDLRHEAEENGVTVQHQAGFNFGWNACLDAINRGKEE